MEQVESFENKKNRYKKRIKAFVGEYKTEIFATAAVVTPAALYLLWLSGKISGIKGVASLMPDAYIPQHVLDAMDYQGKFMLAKSGGPDTILYKLLDSDPTL